MADLDEALKRTRSTVNRMIDRLTTDKLDEDLLAQLTSDNIMWDNGCIRF